MNADSVDTVPSINGLIVDQSTSNQQTRFKMKKQEKQAQITDLRQSSEKINNLLLPIL